MSGRCQQMLKFSRHNQLQEAPLCTVNNVASPAKEQGLCFTSNKAHRPALCRPACVHKRQAPRSMLPDVRGKCQPLYVFSRQPTSALLEQPLAGPPLGPPDKTGLRCHPASCCTLSHTGWHSSEPLTACSCMQAKESSDPKQLQSVTPSRHADKAHPDAAVTQIQLQVKAMPRHKRVTNIPKLVVIMIYL